MREPGTYSVKRELRVLICRDYYMGITTLADNYWLVNNSWWIMVAYK